MGSRVELLELALHLKQERLFIKSERQYLQSLNEKVLKTVEKLFHIAWIAKQQRITLDGLILSKPDYSPALCCERANCLESVNFIDAYKLLGFQESLYGDFLRQLHANPKLVGMCLVATEKIKIELMHHIVNVVMSSIYGHCMLQEDESYVLQLLRHLMELQLATSDNPRRLLRHGSCAFSHVYKSFNEGLFTAKLFLTAALHDPIMQLLMEDELYLDIDPSKAAIRFPPQERLHRFGKEGTAEYISNLQKYRNWTITKLVNLTNRFIVGIKENMFCFPPSLVWLVKQLYNMVMKAKKVEVREVGAMCIDLIFSFFICPAIVNPEPYGICDTPISSIARFNLMQVAQILHVLAMSKWEEIEPKLMDVYGRFEKECISSLLDIMLEGSVEDEPPVNGSQLHNLNRSAILINESDLQTLVTLLRTILNDGNFEDIDRKTLETILTDLPTTPPTSGHTNSSDNFANDSLLFIPSSASMKKNNLSVKGKMRNKTRFTPGTPEQLKDKSKSEPDDTNTISSTIEDVLIVSLNSPLNECPGMLSEQKVLLCMEQQNRHSKVRVKLENLSIEDGTQEKRTRFSLSHDQDSIGTSDNLEAISEAASNHSVSSSLELENENENDNLSDMVSANVSGRGTPNVSGRDTPSSQTGGDEPEERPLNLPIVTPKQNQEDIDDRFGKFDIKPLIEGDETISLVSDTWSTDVLASDSEMVESQIERPLDDITIPSTGHLDAHQAVFGLHQSSVLDAIDTASEAWSTDVMASDSERLQELDTDDTGSIARSDDAASIARSDDIIRYESDAYQHAECEPLNVTDHNTDENNTPRASGSRSPVDGAPSKSVQGNPTVQSCIETSNNVRMNRLPEDLLQELNFQPSKEVQTDSMHQDLNITSAHAMHTAHLASCKQGKQNYYADRVESDIPNDSQGESFIRLSDGNNYSQKKAQTPLISDVWNTGEVHNASDSVGMQTLGRLSINLGELPDNGILTGDNSVFAATSTPTDLLDMSTNNITNDRSNLRDDSMNCETHSDMTSLEIESLIDDSHKATDQSEMQDVLHGEKHKHCPSHNKMHVDEKSIASGVRLSTGSLTSSVSSSSSSGSAPNENNAKNDITSSQETSVSSTVVGAIPKSISFDKTAERGDKEFDSDDQKHKKGFLKNIKVLFVKGRTRKSSRSHEEMGIPSRSYDRAGGGEMFRAEGFYSTPHRHLRRNSAGDTKNSNSEIIEDILDKYRKKPASMIENDISLPSNAATINSAEKDTESGMSTGDDDHQVVDSSNLETSYAFADANRKLRLVLSSADIGTLLWSEGNPFIAHSVDNDKQHNNELVAFLKIQLAEAINLQDKLQVAQLRETLRCVQLFDKEGSKKLFRSLREDYKKRAPYIAYLVRSRQGLLTTLAHLERILDRIERDKITCNKFMISVCVRLFLEKREHLIQRFVSDFQKLTVADEKTDLVEQFLQYLYKEMEVDALWQAASEEQTEQAQITIERNIMSQMYIHALYPNGDGDVMRDKILYEHILKLSRAITPNHKYLKIPKIYQYECPWPAAQAEIVTVNAYKTPRDKLQCVLRCCNTIMNLLRLANEKIVPAADDFMPVLVYVVVHANPPNLLSNIQYVNSFYHKKIIGEDAYWWTQFCSGVEFIKTMEYDN